MKKIAAIIITVSAVLAAPCQLRAQYNSSVITDKYVEGPGNDGNYTLTLETYVTGKIGQQAIEVPADIIIAMDYSGSMKNTGGYDYPTFNAAETKLIQGTGKKGGAASKAWSYSGVGYGNTSGTAAYQYSYYYEPDETWYPVRRSKTLPRSATSATKDVRALWIVTKSGETWYLRGTGLSDTYDTSIRADNATIFTGELRKGWRYYKKLDNDESKGYDNKSPYYGINYGNADGTANSQWYYKHTDGKYYPVRRSNKLPDSKGTNTARALWVVIDGETKYLTCSGLADDYDHTIVSDKVSICFLDLYKGWTDATITAVATDYGAAGAAGGHYYKHSDGIYYPVKKEQMSDSGTKYQSVVMIDGTKWYLNGDGITQDPCPVANGTKMSIYFGSLYTVKTVKAFTKYEGLKRAVTGFIDALYNHSVEKGGYEHRVALLAWGSGIWYTQSTIKEKKGDKAPTGSGSNTSVTYNNSGNSSIRYKIAYPNLKEYSASGASCQSVRILKDFRNIMNTTERNQLIAEFDAQPTKWELASDPRWGLQLTRKLFQREGTPGGVNFNDVNGIENYEKPLLSGDALANYASRPKIVILISDGDFNGFNKSGYTDSDDNTKTYYPPSDSHSKSEINYAITYANDMKEQGITIYDIHVSTKPVNANEKAIASGPDYVLTATNYTDELLNAMLSVVQDIDGASVNLGSTAVIQDVVTKEFSVPGNLSDIGVYTSACIGATGGSTGGGDEDDEGDEGEVGDVTGSGELIFSETLEPFAADVSKTVNPDGTTTVLVTNFDYAANWCGKHADGNYDGRKLVLKIPIKPDDNLVGGKIATNTSQSVVIDGDGKPIQVFPTPYIGPLPVHIQIAKQGLLKDESAVFGIYRKPLDVEDDPYDGGSSEEDEETGGATGPENPDTPANPVYESEPFMTVILTGKEDGSEVIADIAGLDPGYCYKVVEMSWSWRYESDVKERDTETTLINPLRFVNTLRNDNLLKSGEDTKQNKFF